MKLNNKGFAITGILYGLLILFALLVGSYLTVLTARKNRLDGIVENIENEYNNKENITSTYTLTFIKGNGIKEIYYSKDMGEFTIASGRIGVENGDIIYYYGVPQEGYNADCTKNSTCSTEIGKSIEITVSGSLKQQTETITADQLPYTTLSDATCTFNLTSSSYGTLSCTLDIAASKKISFSNRSVLIDNKVADFEYDSPCDMANSFGDYTSFNSVIISYK